MNGRSLLLCSIVNFKKWIIDKRIYMIISLMIAFNIMHFSGIYGFARSVNRGVTPWVFPHLFSHPLVLPVYGCFMILLFCDAPFINGHTPFVAIRTGRVTWILGQLLYIIMAGFLFALLTFIICVLSFFPHIEFSSDWGAVLRTIAMDGNAIAERGFRPSVAIVDNILTVFTPLNATLISLGLLFETTVFIGTLMLCLNIAVSKISGIIVSGILVFLSYFSIFIGKITIGVKIYYFSPLSWCSLIYLDWYNTGNSPSIIYAAVMLAAMTILLSVISVVMFCKRDVQLSIDAE